MHDGLFEKLQGQNIGSFSTLAFALGSPQNPVSDDEFTKLADAVFETQSTLGITAILRRLHFESCTLLIAEMKTQSACADASEPIRKLPSLKAAAGGRPRLEEPFERLMHDPRINVHLIAMPKVAAQQPPKRPLEPEPNRPSPVPKKPFKCPRPADKPAPQLPDELTGLPGRQKQGSQCVGISTCPKAATTQLKAADVVWHA